MHMNSFPAPKAASAGFPPLVAPKKTAARAALVDVKDSAKIVLAECFRQFGVEAVLMGGDASERLKREKFQACVVRLDADSSSVLDAVRTSSSNSRMVIYGVGGSVQDAMKYSKFGINAVFNEPLERPTALKLMRATQMLLVHELRRYVRIPIITEVLVELGGNERFSASSLEISSGGMSLKSREEIAANQPVEVSFALMTLPRISLKGFVSWRNSGVHTFGIRFDAQDPRRLRIKQWIDSCFEN
ncbi:MAG: PilZ domain-containing protein [Acidobacteriota bacterium]|jgi:hypothetical protein|nr:PilZ domain-containing protein [Acidobacteriota bacterium]